MKLDATRYNMFWSNPEKYRLREVWKLAPEEPKAGTFASMMTFGRRRGTCFHELMDGRARRVPRVQSVQELYEGGFGDKEINAAVRMADAVRDPDEVLAHEALFEYPIPGTPHVMTGRIDSIIREYDEVLVLDYKTSKHRNKTDANFKLDQYCRGAQVPFYLLGSEMLGSGFAPAGFVYRLVMDSPKGVQVLDRRTARTKRELAEFARGVAQTCDLIEFLKKEFGVERPWPQLPSPFDSDYASIAGRRMYADYLPDGFVPKVEHLETMGVVDAV